MTDSTYPHRFSRAGATYDRYARVQEDMAAWLAEWLPSRPEGMALELAAGTGAFTSKLQPWGQNLLATDSSPEMVRLGRTRLPEFRWAAQDAARPLPGRFSWIFSSSFLQWASEPERLLRLWREGLEADGRLLCGFYIHETLPELAGLLEGPTPLSWRTAAQWRACFSEAGLEILRSEERSLRYRYPSALDLLRSLHGTGSVAASNRLSGGKLRALLQTYARRYQDGSGVYATWTFFRIEASGIRVIKFSENP